MAGGGALGEAAGINQSIMTGPGFIIIVFQFFISMWTRIGGDITGAVTGMDTGGNISGFLTTEFNRTGRTGRITGTGKNKGPGTSGIISLDRRSRERYSDKQDSGNINSGSLRFNNRSDSLGSNNHVNSPRYSNRGEILR
jgi:hypothetical protein